MTDKIKKKINMLDRLPTLPGVVSLALSIIRDTKSNINDLVYVLEKDPSLTANILKLVNSPYYFLPVKVNNIQRAVGLVGYNKISQLILTSAVLSVFRLKKSGRFDRTQLWRHSLICAIYSECISKHLNIKDNSHPFTVGLLHDIGKITLAAVDGEMLDEIVNLARSKGIEFIDAERKIGVMDHTLLGLKLAKKWRLPMEIQAGIQFHHISNPNQRGRLPSGLHEVVDVVFLSDILSRRLKIGSSGDNYVPEVDNDVMERLGINSGDIDEIMARVPKMIEEAKEFFDMLG